MPRGRRYPLGVMNLESVRSEFPALDTPWALMDNAGGSAPCRGVIDRLRDYLERLPFQLGASYPLSREAGQAVADGRRAAERLLGAEPGELVLGGSSTALVKQLAASLRPLWREGDRVIVTNVDHEANIGPWRGLEASGIEVRTWSCREGEHELALEDLEALLTPKTRLVAFTHCSNIVGSILDVPAITKLVRDAGALSCVDGVAFAPHRHVDFKTLGADFYFASLYKVYGPHIGALAGRREHLLAARGTNHFFVAEDALPNKFEPGNVNYEATASLVGVTEYLEKLAGGDIEQGFERIAAREEELVAPLLGFLDSHPRVRLVGDPRADSRVRVPTVSFVVEGRRSSEITELLDSHSIAARHGHFYAYHLIEHLGLLESDGVVRVSLLHYNTPDEVGRLLGALEEIL